MIHINGTLPWGLCPVAPTLPNGDGMAAAMPSSACRNSGLRHFFEVFIAPLRLRRGQGAMQGNPCYARLFADLTRMSPNPIKASGGCGPRTPGGFFDSLGTAWRQPCRPFVWEWEEPFLQYIPPGVRKPPARCMKRCRILEQGAFWLAWKLPNMYTR